MSGILTQLWKITNYRRGHEQKGGGGHEKTSRKILQEQNKAPHKRTRVVHLKNMGVGGEGGEQCAWNLVKGEELDYNVFVVHILF
jgi:hypothetical protein